MIIAENLEQLTIARGAIKGTVALVTTMGNLHQGHLSLIERAKQEAEFVIVTIYVNPLQFSVNEDLSSYPRTLEDDINKLEKLGVDILFTPTDKVIYPNGMENHTQVVVPGISDLYCGADRKGHFRGVTTIVCKLFSLIKPNLAIFGNKDFQQLFIIRQMVSNLVMPIELIGIDTYREGSGLALSSRNRYLTEQEKHRASGLYKTLSWAKQQLISGNKDFSQLESQAHEQLTKMSFAVEYFTVCNSSSLAPAQVEDCSLVIITAARMGSARLIDNIIVDL